MNVDLRELMRQRSTVETAAPIDRLAEVRRRIRQLRRRRAGAVAATCAAVVVAIVVGATVGPARWSTAPNPATTTRVGAFPEYQQGAHLIGTAVGELPDTEISVTVTPSTLDLGFMVHCSAPMWIEVEIGGLTGSSTSTCSPGSEWSEWSPATTFAEWGFRPGQPFTVYAKAIDYPGYGPEVRLPERGAFALAVMQRVPFEEYQFPPRPATLTPLTVDPGAAFVLRSDPADPLRTVSGTMAWSSATPLVIASQTPGYIRVLINGVLVGTHESWDYDLGETTVSFGYAGPPYADGEIVTVTAEPDRVSGAWVVWAGRPTPVRLLALGTDSRATQTRIPDLS
jgi:hypothetical protein